MLIPLSDFFEDDTILANGHALHQFQRLQIESRVRARIFHRDPTLLIQKFAIDVIKEDLASLNDTILVEKPVSGGIVVNRIPRPIRCFNVLDDVDTVFSQYVSEQMIEGKYLMFGYVTRVIVDEENRPIDMIDQPPHLRLVALIALKDCMTIILSMDLRRGADIDAVNMDIGKIFRPHR